MIFQASLLLTDEWITLAQLELELFNRQLAGSGRRRDRRRLERIRRIRGELESYQDEFYGSVADSISDLYRRLIEAKGRPGNPRARSTRKQRPTSGDAVDTLVQAANYSYARAEFAVLRRRLA